jgi:pilus assembly protein Flp/PilA
VARLITFLQTYLDTKDQQDDDQGATMVEYGLIVSVIALVVVVGAGVFGTALSTFFSDLAGSLGWWRRPDAPRSGRRFTPSGPRGIAGGTIAVRPWSN